MSTGGDRDAAAPLHVYPWAPFVSVTSGATTSWTCSCACGICMAGGCCMDPSTPRTPTITTTGTGWPAVFHEHDYAKFDAKRLFCHKCGETKDVR